LLFVADVHSLHAVVKAFDDLTCADFKLQWLTAIGGIEDLSIRQSPGIMNLHRIALLRLLWHNLSIQNCRNVIAPKASHIRLENASNFLSESGLLSSQALRKSLIEWNVHLECRSV
jgi:hypothetical protein